jgi:Transposase, Mutator family
MPAVVVQARWLLATSSHGQVSHVLKMLGADVVGIFPNEASIIHLIGAVLFEQNDEWQASSCYMMVEAFVRIDNEEIDSILSVTTKVA